MNTYVIEFQDETIDPITVTAMHITAAANQFSAIGDIKSITYVCPAIKLINSRKELQQFATVYRLSDWHEPDEQDISARVEGVSFDNAGFWPANELSRPINPDIVELHVIITHLGVDVAAVNLATLFSWAAQ